MRALLVSVPTVLFCLMLGLQFGSAQTLAEFEAMSASEQHARTNEVASGLYEFLLAVKDSSELSPAARDAARVRAGLLLALFDRPEDADNSPIGYAETIALAKREARSSPGRDFSAVVVDYLLQEYEERWQSVSEKGKAVRKGYAPQRMAKFFRLMMKTDRIQQENDAVRAAINAAQLEVSLAGTRCLRMPNAMMVHGAEDGLDVGSGGRIAYTVENYLRRDGEWFRTVRATYHFELRDIDRFRTMKSHQCTVLRLECRSGDCVTVEEAYEWDAEAVSLYFPRAEDASEVLERFNKLQGGN